MQSRDRNYGVDLLRIISMLMICVIHVNLWTGACSQSAPATGPSYFFSTWLQTLCFIGVNIFGIITGYVYINTKWKFARYLPLWFQVAFYTVVLTLSIPAVHILGICVPFGGKDIIKMMSLLPFGSSYWYFAAYTALFFCIPYLNRLLINLSQCAFVHLLCLLAIVLPIMTFFQKNIIYGNGYNFTWLITLYALGAYMKLFPIKIAPAKLFIFCLFCTLIPISVRWAGFSTYRIFEYSHPLFCVYGACCFLAFSQIKIENSFMLRSITWAAPFSFGVYLIHVHPFVWLCLKKYIPHLYSSLHHPWWFSCACGIILFCTCLIADMLRFHLFRLCRINRLTEYLSARIEAGYDYLIRHLRTPRV